jgi:hypothetical protein
MADGDQTAKLLLYRTSLVRMKILLEHHAKCTHQGDNLSL